MNTLATDLVLTAGLPPEELDERLRSASRLCDVGHRALAFYLADMHRRGAHSALGMPNTVTYAVRALGMSRRSAREHLAVGLRLGELERIDEAFNEGAISWSRVRRIASVATTETELEWLACAQRVSQDELDARTRRARPGDAPHDDGLPSPRFALHVELDAVQHEMWEAAREKLRAECGHGEDLSDDVVIQELLELLLRSDADGSVPGRKQVEGAPFRVVVDDAAPDRASSDAVTPPRLRRRVLDRDRQRCVNCRSRRSLHAHHIEWRSRGGPTTFENLVTLCGVCHGLVHGGWLDVEPRASGGFAFRDARDRIIERRVLTGPRVTLEAAGPVAHCATREPVPDEVDRHWFLAHEARIVTRGGKLVLT